MTRAIINRSINKGRKFADLCKAYETEDFYQLIVDSVTNGYRDQAVKYFNMLKGHNQYAFLICHDYGEIGRLTKEIIIEALFAA